MSLNAQQKRVSKNRVSITYDVEDGGAKQTKELPFVIGMIGGYSGDREDREALHERTFYNVDKDNFDQVLKRVAPKVSMFPALVAVARMVLTALPGYSSWIARLLR